MNFFSSFRTIAAPACENRGQEQDDESVLEGLSRPVDSVWPLSRIDRFKRGDRCMGSGGFGTTGHNAA